MKKLTYFSVILVAIIMAGLTANRVIHISSENKREVFNADRVAESEGIPVETMLAKVEKSVLREPVAIKNGKIFVSKGRIHKFRPGQTLTSGGKIVSISKTIDMDTGLFAIKTSGDSGNHFVELEHHGIFVPLSAISNSVITISEKEVATQKQIDVVAADAERAVIKGLTEGDVIILTKVEPKSKIKSVIQR